MKKPYVLYSRMGSITGRELRERLNIRGGRSLDDASNVSWLLRWGCSNDPDMDTSVIDGGGRVLNRARFVNTVANRHHMFNNIATIARVNSMVDAHRLRHNTTDLGDRTVLLRHRYSRWGDDIVVYNQELEHLDDRHPRLDGYFAVEYWPGDYEVRVHILQEKSICFQIKKKRDGAPPDKLLDGTVLVRNVRNGWGLYPVDNAEAARLGIKKNPIRDCARSLVKLFNLQFAAVDFLVRVPSGAHGTQFDYRILELNTSPGIEGNTLDKYVAGFEAIFKGELPEADDGPGAVETSAPAPPTPTTRDRTRERVADVYQRSVQSIPRPIQTGRWDPFRPSNR